MRWIFFLSLPLYALDQLTKRWVLHHIDPEASWVILPRYFEIVNITNTGAAFGSFKNNNAFFIALSCVALISVAMLLLRKGARPDIWRDVSLALLLAGILGNLTALRFASATGASLASLQRRRLVHLRRGHQLHRLVAARETRTAEQSENF